MKLKVGDRLPNSELFFIDENNQVKTINSVDLCENDKIIILGMPGAFTRTCSSLHLPGYVNNYELALKKGVKKIICISVNDPHVMRAWGKNHNTDGKILMVGDPYFKFTKMIGAETDISEKGLGIRSKRYSMLVEKGEVKKVEEEEKTGICELSSAERFLNAI